MNRWDQWAKRENPADTDEIHFIACGVITAL